MEIEYWRNRHQRMNWERFTAASALALVTHTIVQPLDLAKVRAQVLQEGKLHTGIGFQRGFHMTQILEEIHNAGGGMRKMYTSLDGFVMRTLAYTTGRLWGFLYFYDWLNPDPRRTARISNMLIAGTLGGFVGGVVTNPVDLVFTRMQVDEMYPEGYKRNYKNFLDGLGKAADEGVLLRGSIANGLKLGMLCATITNVADFLKENTYFFLGPSWWNRWISVAAAAGIATATSLPFDAVRNRMHTMRPLPDGRMPYTSSFDCLNKMLWYEGSAKHSSNLNCFYAGGQAYGVRYFGIFLISQYMLDYYHANQMVSEFWQPARFKAQTGIDYDIHEPFTDGFNKAMMQNWSTKHGQEAFSPTFKDKFTAV